MKPVVVVGAGRSEDGLEGGDGLGDVDGKDSTISTNKSMSWMCAGWWELCSKKNNKYNAIQFYCESRHT